MSKKVIDESIIRTVGISGTECSKEDCIKHPDCLYGDMRYAHPDSKQDFAYKPNIITKLNIINIEAQGHFDDGHYEQKLDLICLDYSKRPEK